MYFVLIVWNLALTMAVAYLLARTVGRQND